MSDLIKRLENISPRDSRYADIGREAAARIAQLDRIVRTVATLDLGLKGYCRGSLFALKEQAMSALASETGTVNWKTSLLTGERSNG